ncbi:MAG: hypothetical protein K8T91_07195, partial [Planctomycetes bacterium]|nr:hypothetical protein [Planctomycetota bacterium]
MRWKAWLGLGTGVLVALLGLGFWYWPVRESPQLLEVKKLQTEMQQKMFAPAADAKIPSPEERRAGFEQMREKMDALTEAERKQAAQAMHEGFSRQMGEKMKKFFALSSEEQTAALDKEIDEQEARRKAGGGFPFGPPPGGPPPGGSPPGGSPPAGPPDARAPAGNTNSGPGAAPGRGGPGNRPFGPPGNWQNMTAEQRRQMQRQML